MAMSGKVPDNDAPSGPGDNGFRSQLAPETTDSGVNWPRTGPYLESLRRLRQPQVTAAPKVQGNLGTDALPKSPVPEGGEHPKPMPNPNSNPLLDLDPSHARQHPSKPTPSSRRTPHDKRAAPDWRSLLAPSGDPASFCILPQVPLHRRRGGHLGLAMPSKTLMFAPSRGAFCE